MNRVCLLLLFFPILVQANEDEKLAQFFKDYLEATMKASPVSATRFGDHRFDDRMDDLSEKARLANQKFNVTTLQNLPKAVQFEKLSKNGKIDYQILRDYLTKTIWLDENTNPFRDDPRIWNEYISDSVFILFTQSTLPKEKNIRNAAARIAEIPKVVKEAMLAIGNPPKEITETAIRQNKGSINFYEKGIFEITGETPNISILAEPCKAAVTALKEYQTFLEKVVLPRAKGEWRIGKEKFAKKLVMEIDTGISAEELYKEALNESERVQKEMYTIAKQLWAKLFPKAVLPVDDPAGRRETIRKVLDKLADDHGEAATLLEDTKKTAKEIREFIRAKDILRLPEPDRCKILEMPEFQRGNSTAYLNPAPPLDAKAESVYAVSPPPKEWDDKRQISYFREYNRAMLKLLTIHEAYPGHYVQLEYSNRNPSLIRKILYSGTYAEGWAVYTEQMMLDQGFGEGDLSLRLHQLKWYLRAVTNAILDYQMHCENLSDEQALKLLVEGAFQSEGEAIGKILRAKQSSCQLSTYFAGRTAFYKLRQQIQKEQGDAFILGRYHEAVLEQGTIPVKYLPDLVRETLKTKPLSSK
ncbi:MAG: DUF885 domain-containing protein [Gemmataceae bacterium]|jgi:uncharacterized protein (DUF885 family)|nr:DUF885 domain-containing protein [Gemmataceae bacterium]